MLARLLIISFLAAAFLTRAEVIVSQSRQFVVHFSGANVRVGTIPPTAVEVVPELLVVTAERVKQALVTEIPALAAGRTQIHIGVADLAGPESLVAIGSSRYADAWRYEMAVPRVVEEARLIKGLINVLLLEYANRGADRSAELPAWLTEGLARELLFGVGPKLVVVRAPTAWEASTRDLLYWSRESLRTNATPSFHDLTTAFVPAKKSTGESVYLAGAHLLVHSLLQMPNGRQNFAKFLQTLPRTWNWQTAFLNAFGFQQMLEVEKWWSLSVIEFTTRDQRHAWSTEMSLRKLDELLMTRVEIRGDTNTLPDVRLIDLSTLMEDDDAQLRLQAINDKILQISYTVPHMAPQVGVLALEYKNALETYLKRRNGLAPGSSSRTIRRLTTLDLKRRALAEVILSSAR